MSQKLVVGVTLPELVKNKPYPDLIEPYEIRKEAVREYLEKHQKDTEVEIVALSDPFGPTVLEPKFEALVATELTKKGAEAVNRERFKRALPELIIELVPLYLNSQGEYLTSSSIRQGRVSRQGEVYWQIFDQDIELNPSLRRELAKKHGQLLPSGFDPEILKAGKQVVLVGDIVTQLFIDRKLTFDLAVIDYLTKRQPVQTETGKINWELQIEMENPGGMVKREAATAIIELEIKSPTLITVEGEEDLLVLPLILSLPLNSLIFYGQPDEGVVMIEVTEAVKNRWFKKLKRG